MTPGVVHLSVCLSIVWTFLFAFQLQKKRETQMALRCMQGRGGGLVCHGTWHCVPNYSKFVLVPFLICSVGVSN